MDEIEWKVRRGNSIQSDSDSPTVPFSSWNVQIKLRGSVGTLNELQFQNFISKAHGLFPDAIWTCSDMLQIATMLKVECLYMYLKKCWFCHIYPIAMVEAFQYPQHMRFTLLFILQQSITWTIITVDINFRHKCPAIPRLHFHTCCNCYKEFYF